MLTSPQPPDAPSSVWAGLSLQRRGSRFRNTIHGSLEFRSLYPLPARRKPAAKVATATDVFRRRANSHVNLPPPAGRHPRPFSFSRRREPPRLAITIENVPITSPKGDCYPSGSATGVLRRKANGEERRAKGEQLSKLFYNNCCTLPLFIVLLQ